MPLPMRFIGSSMVSLGVPFGWQMLLHLTLDIRHVED
jgi:hypothetical protein